MRLWSATRWIITINIAIFLLDLLSNGGLTSSGCLSYAATVSHLQLWRLFTYQFLHGGVLHIFFNLLILFYFGPLIEPLLGRLWFTVFYLASGIAGAILFLLFSKPGLLGLTPDTFLIGASASIFGVMGAAARVMPNAPVQVVLIIVPPIQLRMFNLVLIYVGIAFVVLFTAGQNAGGELSHLGGALSGYAVAGGFRRTARGRSPTKRSAFWRPGQSNFLREEFKK